MKDIKADMKHLQQLQVVIDVQRAAAIQMLAVLDKKTHNKLRTSLSLLLTKATYEDKMRYAKSSLPNLERGSVGSRLSKIYYPTDDGTMEETKQWVTGEKSSRIFLGQLMTSYLRNQSKENL